MTPKHKDDSYLYQIFDILKHTPQLADAPVVYFMSKVTDHPFKILIATLLSLRTKDEVTGPATQRLFEIIQTPEELLQISSSEIEKIIYPVGFYKRKAQQIINISSILVNNYHSKVPNDMDLLLSLPGVGRKTANLVLSVAFNQPAVCVDIHVHRISNRLGFCSTKNPEETEFYIRKNVNKDLWNEFNRPLVALGQVICRPISPKCDLCPIASYCDKNIKK